MTDPITNCWAVILCASCALACGTICWCAHHHKWTAFETSSTTSTSPAGSALSPLSIRLPNASFQPLIKEFPFPAEIREVIWSHYIQRIRMKAKIYRWRNVHEALMTGATDILLKRCKYYGYALSRESREDLCRAYMDDEDRVASVQRRFGNMRNFAQRRALLFPHIYPSPTERARLATAWVVHDIYGFDFYEKNGIFNMCDWFEWIVESSRERRQLANDQATERQPYSHVFRSAWQVVEKSMQNHLAVRTGISSMTSIDMQLSNYWT